MIVDRLVAELGFDLRGEGDLARFNRGLDQAQRKAGGVATALQGMAASAAAAMAAVAGAMVVALPGIAIKKAADFESMMTEIEKKAGATAKQMAKLRDEILDLSTGGELASSIEEIAGAYERGAAAGVPLDELREFALLSAMAADAFEMTAEAVGNAAAGFEKGLGVARSELEPYFDLINSLADSGISDEADIINFLDRAGASLTTLGLSKEQAAALGATLVNLKMPAEVAARAMDTLGGKLMAPQNLGKKSRTALGEIVGDLKAFSKVMGKDANAGLMLFLENLEKMDKADQIGLLGALLGEGFDDEVLRLVKGLDEYRRNLELIADTEQWLGSLRQTYAKKLDDFWSRWKIFKNNLDAMFISIGDHGLPALSDALDEARKFLRRMVDDGTAESIGKGFGQLSEGAVHAARQVGRIGAAAYYAADGLVDLISRVTGLDKVASAGVLGAGILGSSATGRAMLLALAKRTPALAALLLVDELVTGLSGGDSRVSKLAGGPEALAAVKTNFADLHDAAKGLADTLDELFNIKASGFLASPGDFMDQELLRFVQDLAAGLRTLADALNALKKGDMNELGEVMADSPIYKAEEGGPLDRLWQWATGDEEGGLNKAAKRAQAAAWRALTGGGEDAGPIKLPRRPGQDPLAAYRDRPMPAGLANENLSGKGDRLRGAQPNPDRFGGGGGTAAGMEQLRSMLDNMNGNLARMTGEAPVNATITDARTDARSFPVNTTVNTTVNVQQAAQAPGAVGAAVGAAAASAVNGAAAAQPSRMQTGPAE